MTWSRHVVIRLENTTIAVERVHHTSLGITYVVYHDEYHEGADVVIARRKSLRAAKYAAEEYAREKGWIKK